MLGAGELLDRVSLSIAQTGISEQQSFALASPNCTRAHFSCCCPSANDSAPLLTDFLGRSLRYSTSAVRWKAVAQSWLTPVTCRLVEIFRFPNGACEGREGPFGTSSAGTGALLSNGLFGRLSQLWPVVATCVSGSVLSLGVHIRLAFFSRWRSKPSCSWYEGVVSGWSVVC